MTDKRTNGSGKPFLAFPSETVYTEDSNERVFNIQMTEYLPERAGTLFSVADANTVEAYIIGLGRNVAAKYAAHQASELRY